MVFKLFKRKKESSDLEKEQPVEEKVEQKQEEQPNYKKPKAEIESKVQDKKIIEALKQVEDPELGIDIWSLELIYDIDINENNLDIKMTFTSPMCPYGPQLVDSVKEKLKEINYEPNIEIVFSPFWKPSEEVKEILGLS
ncbi:MAG: metal-sulfur cluster assembly factor [Nanoarchaeota archaeon]